MGQTCKTCHRPDRAEIDRAILAGEPNRRIASRCDVSEAAIRRHASHISEAVSLAVRAEETCRADDLLGLLREAVGDARRLRQKMEAEGDHRGSVVAVKTLCEVVERLASIGERLAASGRDAEPIKIEWVNDWRPATGAASFLPEPANRTN